MRNKTHMIGILLLSAALLLFMGKGVTLAAFAEEVSSRPAVETDELSDAILEAGSIDMNELTPESIAKLNAALLEADLALYSNDQAEINLAASRLRDVVEHQLERSSDQKEVSQIQEQPVQTNQTGREFIGVVLGVAVGVVTIGILVGVIEIYLIRHLYRQEKLSHAQRLRMNPQVSRPVKEPVQVSQIPFDKAETEAMTKTQVHYSQLPAASPAIYPQVPAVGSQMSHDHPLKVERQVYRQGAAPVYTSKSGTTVLGASANETAVKAQRAYGTLHRLSTREYVELRGSALILGKSSNLCDVTIPDNRAISARHAELFYDGNQVLLADLHSTNGTYINGFALPSDTRICLRNLDRIVLANEEFIIKLN